MLPAPRSFSSYSLLESGGGAFMDRSTKTGSMRQAEFLALKHNSRILGYSSNPVCGNSMMKHVRVCAVLPMENWLGSSWNQIQGGTAVRESYYRALEQGTLIIALNSHPSYGSIIRLKRGRPFLQSASLAMP